MVKEREGKQCSIVYRSMVQYITVQCNVAEYEALKIDLVQCSAV